MVKREGGRAGLKTSKGAEGNLRVRSGAYTGLSVVGDVSRGAAKCLQGAVGSYVDVFQGVRILLELGIDFQYNAILVELGVDGGDLALAEGVVESVVDGGGQNAQAGRGVAVDNQRSEKALVELVTGNVADHGNVAEFVHKARHPVGELLGVGILQAVLKFRAADAVFDGEVLHRLHKQRDAVDFGQLRLEATDDVGSVNLPLCQRLEIDLNAAGVQSGVRAVDSDERRKGLDRRIFEDDFA